MYLLRFKYVVIALTLALAFEGAAICASDGSDFLGEGPVHLEADQMLYDKSSGIYHAEGNVLLRRGEMSLLSHSLAWDTQSGEVVAEGDVQIADPAGTVSGDSVVWDVDSGLGRIEEGRVFLREKNFHLTGDAVEKTGAQSFHVDRGTFTTCDGEIPSWKFGARDLTVTLGGFARGKHVIFYLHDIPVLYIPYILYPVQTERESGFLLPSAGYSDKKGTQLSLAYYQVIAPNQDATLYLDYLSRLGLGKGLEYRYIFGHENEGIWRGYHISSSNGSGDRYAIDWNHFGFLPGNVRLSADVEYVSSRDYFEDFGNVAGEYNKDQTKSIVYLSRAWGKTNATAQFQYIQVVESNDKTVLQRLPEMRVDVIRQRLGQTPFYLQLDTSSTYFWRLEGLKGERLELRPVVAAAFRPWGAFDVSPEFAYRERLYWTSDGNDNKGLPEVSLRMSTRLSRVFSLGEDDSSTRIRHSMEPEWTYYYTPYEDQSVLPQFDNLDRIEGQNRISLALTNRLTARLERDAGQSEYLEFLYLRLSGDYDIHEARQDRDASDLPLRPFSPLRAELILRPSRHAYLDVDASYDFYPEKRELTRFNARGNIADNRGNALSVEYRKDREDPDLGDIEYVAGILDTSLLSPVYLNYQHRHDLIDNRRLEDVVDLEYRSQCWSLFLTYRDRPDDSQIMISFSMSGLGRFGGFSRSLTQTN